MASRKQKNLLVKLNLFRSVGETVRCFESLFAPHSFMEFEYERPSDYVRDCWRKYKESPYGHRGSNSLNGNMFEVIINTLLIREGIMPFYLQARVAFVPNVEFDNILYTPKAPISLSLKTSLRERYKQADLEAIALKYVHRNAECYLLTLSEEEYDIVNSKIAHGEAIGLTKAILCTTNDFDNFIEMLRNKNLELAGNVNIIESSQIITKDLLHNEY